MARPANHTTILDEPSHPYLEEELHNGDAAWADFGRWLVSQDSPRGEAILRELELGPGARADDPALVAAYRRVLRVSACGQLVRDMSWKFRWRRGFPERAHFMFAATRHLGPAAFVEERWRDNKPDLDRIAEERVQLEHALGLPEMRFVTHLDLELSEFGKHLPRVAQLLALRSWPNLQVLRIGYAHYAPAWMGADEPHEHALVAADDTAAMLAALPRLRRLELLGHAMFPRLAHPTLLELRLGGHMPVLDGGLLLGERRDDRGLDLPRLQRLELAAMNPSGGVRPPLDASLLDLDPRRLPALEHLELQDAELGDAGAGGVFEAVARSEALPRLRTLHLRSFDVADDVRAATVQRLAPRFAHLERLVVDHADADAARHFANLVGPVDPS